MKRHASLNRIYRLIWSHVQQAWVTVAEITRGQGKKTARKLFVVGVLTSGTWAHAGPSGGQIASGGGSISQVGNTTTINQSSQKLSINWQSFNTSAQETVNFVQPSSNAVAVNRINDVNPTQFFGHLNANGQVYLLNPNGIVFGAGSQINVGGLVASTLEMNSGLDSNVQRFSGAGTGSVINHGSINTSNGGYVAFLGNTVSNQGSISAPSGTVALGAGNDVTLSFADNRLLSLQVNQNTLNNLSENSGLIQADGGAVLLSAGAKDAVLASVVNNTGVVEAKSVQNINGTIVLDGGNLGTVSNSGTLDASGLQAGETGGSIKLLGGTANVKTGSNINASGDSGGGSILVGGNFHGAGPEQNALNVTIEKDSVMNASAIHAGNGGNVAVWSDGTTNMNGVIHAEGGSTGGDGGMVETSGHTLNIGNDTSVKTTAAAGNAGSWLLDPYDFIIAPSGGNITDTALTNALQNGNVTIQTNASSTSCTGATCTSGSAGNGDIIMQNFAGVGGYALTSSYSLTLSAYRHVIIDSSVIDLYSASTGSITLRADNTATGTGTVNLANGSYLGVSGSGVINVYYNPTNYNSPTDYATLNTTNGGVGTFNSKMLVNLSASIQNKTYDATTAATINSISTVGSLPSGITVNSGSATATFNNKNVGTGKTVTVTGVSLSGAGASNYYINGMDSPTANITTANLAVTGVSASNKTYDSTTAATLSGTATVAALGGDSVSVSGTGVGTFANKNVGTGKSVTVTGYTLSGADASNYTIVQPTGLTANITAANLAVTGVTASNKTYDTTTAATLSGTAAVAALGGDSVTLNGTGSGTFADKNVGTGKAVTVTGYSLSGTDASNYNLVQPSGVTANITAANLAVTGITASNKTYDSTTTATLSGTAAVATLGGDSVSVSGTGVGTFANKNVGTGKSVTVTGYTLSGTDASNYTIVQPTGVTANITTANLAVTGVTASNKTYDTTTAATLSGTAAVAALGGDSVTLNGTGSGTFADKNVGTGKAVTVTGYSLSGTDASNYTIVQPTGVTANITTANLAVTGVTASNKTYDSTTTATLSGTAAVAALGGDSVTLNGTGSGTFADKNVGTGKAVTITGYSLSGTDASNYNLVQPTGVTANITPANLVLSGSRAYDGTTSLAGSVLTATGVNGETFAVTGSGDASNLNSKNAQTGSTLNSLTGLALGSSGNGGSSSNYNALSTTGSSISVTPKALTLSGITASNKTYDATTTASLDTTHVSYSGLVGSDSVSLSGAGVGTFADKNVGTGKAVTVTGYTLGGADAGNYTVGQPTGLTANITTANLAVTGVTASNKTYDATTTATLSGTAAVTALGGDSVSVSGTGVGTFADKNVGTGKAVTVTGYTLGGADASNYTIVQPTGLSANITTANLAVTGVSANNKTYDGSTAATLSGTAVISALGSDSVTLNGTGSGTFADKNVGSGKAVTVSGYTLSGTDAGNYTLAQPTGVNANITRANVTVSGITAQDKTFDGTTNATVSTSNAVLTGKVGSDSLTLSATGAFVDAAVGSNKTVNLTSTYGGADVNNYNFTNQATTTASITAIPVAAPPAPIQNIITQTQASVLPPQAATQPIALSLSSTMTIQRDNGIGAPPNAGSNSSFNSGSNSSTNSDPNSNAKNNDKPQETSRGTAIVVQGGGFGANGPTLQIVNGGTKLPEFSPQQ